MITEEPAEPLEAIAVESRTNPLLTALSWVGLALVLFVVSWWVWTRWINPSPGGTIARYVNQKSGYLFESPADEFRVTMPSPWHRTSTASALGATVNVSSSPGAGYDFSVTKTPEPVAALESYKDFLNQAAGQLVTDSSGEVVSQDPPFALVDVAVKNLVYRNGKTYWRVQLLLLKNRLYTLIVKTPNSEKAPYDRMTRAFQMLGPR